MYCMSNKFRGVSELFPTEISSSNTGSLRSTTTCYLVLSNSSVVFRHGHFENMLSSHFLVMKFYSPLCNPLKTLSICSTLQNFFCSTSVSHSSQPACVWECGEQPPHLPNEARREVHPGPWVLSHQSWVLLLPSALYSISRWGPGTDSQLQPFLWHDKTPDAHLY